MHDPRDDDGTRRRAVEQRDARSVGAFVYGVAGERLYHSPICRRCPTAFEPVVFFDTPEAARARDFVACPDCRPDDAEWLASAGRWM